MRWVYVVKLKNNIKKCAGLNKQQNQILLIKSYPNTSAVIILIIKDCLNIYVEELMSFIYSHRGQIAVNKAYKKTTKAMAIFRDVDPKICQ